MQTTINKIDNPVGYIFSQVGTDILLAFTEVQEMLPNELYWETLGCVWNRSYEVRKYKELWSELFRAERPHSQCFMTKQERKVFYRLPEVVAVYQAQDPMKNIHNCFSYFLDKCQAEAMVQGTKLITMKVPVSKIFAYVNYQNRNEIILI